MPPQQQDSNTIDSLEYIQKYGLTLPQVQRLADYIHSNGNEQNIPLLGETQNGVTITKKQALEIIKTYLRENGAESSLTDEIREGMSGYTLIKIIQTLRYQQKEQHREIASRENIINEYNAYKENRQKLTEHHSSSLDKAINIYNKQIDEYTKTLTSVEHAIEQHQQQYEKLFPEPGPGETPPFTADEKAIIKTKLAASLPLVAGTPDPAGALREIAQNDPHITKLTFYSVANDKEIAELVATVVEGIF